METGNMNAHCMEDKKCRICGLADICNINIFTSASGNALLCKILAVYPIVMYQHDPLPKNICKKCINNVNFMYADIQRAMKTQEKWTNNVRRVQPNHGYVRIMDLIENSSNATLKSIKTNFLVDIQRIPGQMIPKESSQITNTSFEVPDTVVNNTRVEVNGPAFQQIQKSLGLLNTKSTTSSPPEIKELKTMLALNGCTLRPVSKSNDAFDSSKSKIDAKLSDTTVKNNGVAGSTQDDIPLSYCSTSTESLKSIKCRYCELKFESQSSLATHQMQHMRLSIPRLCDKKYLQKKLRKGRVITVQERKCIRCLNCWHLFVSNKSILSHWLWGECDFYCHICGEEFPTSPKLLRDHVQAVHGINYRSSKIRQTTLSTHKTACKEEPPPQEDKLNHYITTKTKCSIKQEQSSAINKAATTSNPRYTTQKKSERKHPLDPFSSATCNICHRTFNNFKACNSHMRKHKPSYIYGDIVLSPHAFGDGYNNIDPQIQEGQISKTVHNINAVRSSWPTVRERRVDNTNSAANFITRQVNMKTSTGIRIRSITEMQKNTKPHRTVHPNVITAEATSSLSCWLAASHAATLHTANDQIFENKVKEEPRDFDGT
ncbi:uncharacterized protein LOC129251453 [Anastrepha obliqua]|uniref:uncharacterized protein LOC129251453 n=1 Tax=Anastrepha obliqua TaxID=95512 RepID=UPI0024099DB8|nr:uncharacterized protein LOC129251453 [Anastrepha obliqua]